MIDSDRRVRLGVFLAALCLYLGTQPQAGYNSDVYDYIAVVRTGEARELFHVHHLLFNATGRLWTRLWQALLPGAAPEAILRGLNGLLGALTVLGFYDLLRRFLGRRLDRLLATAILATCFAIWMFSVDAEVYIASTLLLVLAFAAARRAAEGGVSLRGALSSGLLLGGSALYHQMGVLFSPVALAVLGSAPGSRRRRVAAAGICLLTGGVVALIPYIAVGVTWHEVRSAGDFLRWILGYSLEGYGEGLTARSLPMALVGQGRSMVFFGFALRAFQRPGLSALDLACIGLLVAAAATFALGAWGACRGWSRPSARRPLRSVWAPLLLWYLCYAVFALGWEPENPEFWVTASVPFVALWAGGLALAGGRWRWLLVAALTIAFPANLIDLLARRDPGYDPEVRAVQQIASRVGSDAVVLPPALVARSQLFAPGLHSVNLYRVLQLSPPRADEALNALRRRLADERSAGRRVFLYQEAISHRMRSIFPHADATLAALEREERFERRFDVVLPYDPSGRFGTLARLRPVAVFELVPRNAPVPPGR